MPNETLRTGRERKHRNEQDNRISTHTKAQKMKNERLHNISLLYAMAMFQSV